MKRIGVMLAGCGVKDGSEIHEATLTLFYLSRLGVEYVCISPNEPQSQVINHATDEVTSESRNTLTESARIARGSVTPLSDITADDISALIMVGGLGAASNLSDYAKAGRNMTVHPELADLLTNLHEQKKPIGALCIAPVILAKVFGGSDAKVEVTIGSDVNVATDIKAMGALHVIKLVDEILVDGPNRFVTTPAYMLAENIAEIGPGIRKAVETVVDMA